MIATIFIPLTLISGIYGMNFSYIPELKFPWGYPIVLLSMVMITVGMLFYFKKKKWILQRSWKARVYARISLHLIQFKGFVGWISILTGLSRENNLTLVIVKSRAFVKITRTYWDLSTQFILIIKKIKKEKGRCLVIFYGRLRRISKPTTITAMIIAIAAPTT